MKYSFSYTYVSMLSCLFSLHHPAAAQRNNALSADSTDLYNLVQTEYGPDQVLFNGLYPEDYVMDAIGHPFFQDNEFYPGYIVVHNLKYDDVKLKYNIFDQNIIVSQLSLENIPTEVIPPNKFITEFKINDKIFRKFNLDSTNEKIFQVVYDGKIKCLFSFIKVRYVSFHAQKFSSFLFSEEKKKSYLFIDQKIYNYHTFRSFLRLFPDEARQKIRAYCKKVHFRLSKSSDPEIRKLLEYYEN